MRQRQGSTDGLVRFGGGACARKPTFGPIGAALGVRQLGVQGVDSGGDFLQKNIDVDLVVPAPPVTEFDFAKGVRRKRNRPLQGAKAIVDRSRA